MMEMSLGLELVAGKECAESGLSLLTRLGLKVGEVERRPADRHGQDSAGVGVIAVAPDGAAGKGGLKAGDLILELNDTVMGSCRDLERVLACHPAGTHLRFLIYREGIMRFLAVPVDS